MAADAIEQVHRTELLRQWKERLQAFLGAGKGIVGAIGGGKARPSGKIDIAVMQSLSRQGDTGDMIEQYGHVIVDECHHLSAVSFEALLNRPMTRLSGRYRTLPKHTQVPSARRHFDAGLCN